MNRNGTNLGYRFACFLARLVVRLSTRLEVQGLENLPGSGSYVIASNHLGRLDPVLVYCILDRNDIIMLVAEKYREMPLVPWLVRMLDGIWVDRFKADLGAVRQALSRLRKGGVLVLAPEGTRSTTGALVQGWNGAGYLAAKAGVPIVPVALFGTEDKVVVANLRRLRRSPVVARAGEPFTLPAVPNQDREAALGAYTDEIMCRIAALLPPAYRGVYADHPRLEELLGST
jgi:1-acyl-sn-glycerol-3-phosphate acyltransferase